MSTGSTSACGRAAHRAVVELPGGGTVLVVVTHLHHVVDGARPSATSRRPRSWPGWTGAGRRTPTIVMGDFNADPAEPAYAAGWSTAGFRSAFAEANGPNRP